MNYEFLIAVFFLVIYTYIERFLHKDISKINSIIFHILGVTPVILSFVFLFIREFRFTQFFYFGFLISAFGFIIIIISFFQIKENFILTEKFTNKGLYSYMRHPMYSGILIVFIGVSVLSFSYLISAYTLILLIMIFYLIYYEEKELTEKYGKKYQNYKKKVSMLIPKII